MTQDDWKDFKSATHCYLCNEPIAKDDKKGFKVRDHCHVTGKYRGCAHSVCNLHYNYKDLKIPVFFHNLKNYDSHLIIAHAHKFRNKNKINVIAQNSEKFITFGFNHLQFKDSCAFFLHLSLEQVVKLNKYDCNDLLLDNWKNNFKITQTSRYIKDECDLNHLTEKGVYPYDYMNSFDKFRETELPPKHEFYSKLNKQDISDDDYNRAQAVWNHFNIKDLGEYHDLYLETDVYLLADVFEDFRNMCLDYYGLDPAHYFTLSYYAWDAMLLKTNVELDQIHDLNMYEMIERGLRGGMCQVSHKNIKANNKYMTNYDKDVMSRYLMYLDANNLYGKAMSEKLPVCNFEWCNTLDEDDILNYDNGDYGYILDVDLEYPEALHEYHSDYPLAPENMSIRPDMVSDFSKNIYKHYHKGKDYKSDEDNKKLVLNVCSKSNYVVHIRNLKYYLEQGLKLVSINQCIKFYQSEWLEEWIAFNTNKRKEAKNEFEKDLFKLMNNAVFGKTMENVRNHMDFELVDSSSRLEKCINNPTYKSRHIINENLIGVEKLKRCVNLNKPIYVGMAILDLSKLHMYKFYYDVLKSKYQERIKLAYTDTDSYIISIDTDDVYEDLKELNVHMDFSDYPENHPNYDKTNKKVIGKFKDEVSGHIITEFIGLMPKMYCFKTEENKTYKKAKGVPKKIVKREMNFDSYEKTLKENHIQYVQFNKIQSLNHQIFSLTCSKNGLSNFDNKRYWMNNNLSYPHGHYKLLN